MEIVPEDVTLDPVLEDYGGEADAHIDSLLGLGTPLTTVPTIVRHASSNYAAGRYLKNRLKEDARGDALMKDAENEIMRYKSGPGRITVWG